MFHEKLYHLDARDNIRVWFIEQENGQYRTHSGIKDGGIVISEWKAAVPKNIGKVNSTTPEEQATAEIKSIYKNKIDRKYTTDISKASRSNIFQPMLAATYKPEKSRKNVMYHQPKLDGIRMVLMEDGGGFSRAGKPFFTVDHIINEVQNVLSLYNVVLDGELYNHSLKNDFDKLTSLIKQQKFDELSDDEKIEIREKVQFHVYDIILLDNLEASFEERNKVLQTIFNENKFSNIFLVQTGLIEPNQDIEIEHANYIEMGYEGIMLREPNSKYEFKRSKSLQKHKSFMEEEFVVKSISEGIGNWAGAAKTAEVILPSGIISSVGITGTYDHLMDVLINQDIYVNGIATVKFQNFTPEGKLRFGVIKHFWGNKRDL